MGRQDAATTIQLLEFELAKVKQQLAALQSTEAGKHDNHNIQSLKLIAGADDASTFRFLDLPREMRNIIYELCVVVDKIYVRGPGRVTSYDMRITETAVPEVQLFRVCKQINAEARETFLLNNKFVHLPGPRFIGSPTQFHLSTMFNKDLIRRLSISLDYRDYSPSFIDEFVQHEGYKEARLQVPREETMFYLQELTVVALRDRIWYSMFQQISKLVNLKYLQINLQNCYCPSTCHRLVQQAFTSKGHSPQAEAPWAFQLLGKGTRKVIDVVGTLDFAERHLLRCMLMTDVAHIRLQFHGAWTGLYDHERSALWFEDEEATDEYGILNSDTDSESEDDDQPAERDEEVDSDQEDEEVQFDEGEQQLEDNVQKLKEGEQELENGLQSVQDEGDLEGVNDYELDAEINHPLDEGELSDVIPMLRRDPENFL
ncbi:hypothetical protein LTR37_009557 [Vermiconidia calcicola]|uniref:Uncharacterized protein n=1 Tax=Vermiconidia calcicola TaxID=1690605 RepID=A0ACC3N8Q8_9PEZI|nr:hypothetical protein LTR37_009557 [Vermiconidia calcicola]